MEAHEHPAYADAIRHANERAQRDPGERYIVYWDGEAVYVRNAAAAPPANGQRIFEAVKE